MDRRHGCKRYDRRCLRGLRRAAGDRRIRAASRMMRPREIINSRKNLYLMIVGISFTALILLAFLEKYIPSNLFKPLSYGAIAGFSFWHLPFFFLLKGPKRKARSRGG